MSKLLDKARSEQKRSAELNLSGPRLYSQLFLNDLVAQRIPDALVAAFELATELA